MTRIPRPWRSPRLPPEACWEWPGSRNKKGYGHIGNGRGGVTVAHRLAYLECVGPIPIGFDIHHTCENTSCVNPHHLQAVSHAEHSRLTTEKNHWQRRKTHCPQGHPYDAENTYISVRHGWTERNCRECGRRRSREYVRAKRAMKL